MLMNQSSALGQCSALGFGAWAIGGDSHPLSYGSTDGEVSKEALRHALNECVCTLIDTADVYGGGHSEKLIGEVLNEGGYDHVKVVTKIGNNFTVTPQTKDFSYDYCKRAIEASAERLSIMPHVVLFHNPRIEDLQKHDTWEALADISSSFGVHVGISYRDVNSLILPPIPDNPCTVVEVPFNLINRRALPFIQQCAASSIAVLAREPLANGVLTLGLEGRKFDLTDFRASWTPEQVERFTDAARGCLAGSNQPTFLTPAQKAIRWVMNQDSVTCTLVGCKSPAQVEENMGEWIDDYRAAVER